METLNRDLEKKIEKISNISPTNEDKISEILAQKIDKKIEGDLVNIVGEAAQKQSSDYVLKQEAIEYIEAGFNDAKRKQGAYAEISEKNTQHFQEIGIKLAWLGVGIAIVYTVVASVIAIIDIKNSIDYYKYLPIVLPSIFLCEALAFIMLSMSSKALEKMQSFSKEYTTLDIKAAAMKALISYGDKDKILESSKYLVEMERNYILKKDERTIEGEANQQNIAFMKECIQAVHPINNLKDSQEKKPKKP